MNVNNILVPIDYSENSSAAVDHGVSLAKEYDAELHLVHIFEQPYAYADAGFSGTPIPMETSPTDLENERLKLESVKPTEEITYRHRLIIGTPVDELVDYAKKNAIDLVVMGTHGRTGLSRLLMGSVAEGVVRRSPCPVLTIKQPADNLQDVT